MTFGINYLEDYIKTLSPEEIEERAEFAYEACVISRERLINTKSEEKFLDKQILKIIKDFLFCLLIVTTQKIQMLYYHSCPF